MAAEIISQEMCKNMQIVRLFTLFPKMPLFLRFVNKFTHLLAVKVGLITQVYEFRVGSSDLFVTEMAARIISREICKNMQIVRLFTLYPKMPLFL